MKLAVSGKGGVGKTTLSAMLTGAFALKAHTVIALDADPDANLGSALGVPEDEEVTPLADMHDLIKERTGSEDGYGGYFKLNPRVDDLPEKYARQIGNIRLLAIGGVITGGHGCICPATAVVKALLSHLILVRDDVLIMDMEAGIEHLGRATAQNVDTLLVVVDGGRWSSHTAGRIRKLADDIGLKKLAAVANRLRPDDDVDAVRERLGDIPLIGHFHEDADLAGGDFIRVGTDGTVQPTETLKKNLPMLEQILSAVGGREET